MAMSELYCYVNQSSSHEVLSITDHRFPLEKVVLPNEAIIFQALPSVMLEICSIERVTAIYCERIICERLTRKRCTSHHTTLRQPSSD
jgi:hypothetical protein